MEYPAPLHKTLNGAKGLGIEQAEALSNLCSKNYKKHLLFRMVSDSESVNSRA